MSFVWSIAAVQLLVDTLLLLKLLNICGLLCYCVVPSSNWTDRCSQRCWCPGSGFLMTSLVSVSNWNHTQKYFLSCPRVCGIMYIVAFQCLYLCWTYQHQRPVSHKTRSFKESPEITFRPASRKFTADFHGVCVSGAEQNERNLHVYVLSSPVLKPPPTHQRCSAATSPLALHADDRFQSASCKNIVTRQILSFVSLEMVFQGFSY